jgi:hypothetical protein
LRHVFGFLCCGGFVGGDGLEAVCFDADALRRCDVENGLIPAFSVDGDGFQFIGQAGQFVAGFDEAAGRRWARA